MTVQPDAARRHRTRPGGGDDAGFTLIEVVVAVAVIAVVMLGVGAVFVATAAGTDAQGLRQTAARIATDGLDRAHALTGADVVKGRDQDSVTTQWAARPAAVTALLGTLPTAYDPTAPAGRGATAPLPTAPIVAKTDGVAFQQSFFVASCQLDTSGSCGASATAGAAPMYDVVVSVTWPDHTCTTGTCTYQLSTLVAASVSDPLFNTNVKALPPTVATVGDRVQDVGEAVTGLVATFSGGNGAVSLSASGLPSGVTFDSTSGRFGGALGAATSTTVTVTATDRFGLYGSTTFGWTVNPLPKLTAGALTTAVAMPVTTNVTTLLGLTGGTAPVSWACTGLPAGLTLDPATGAVGGAATASATLPATSCTVTDARGRSATAALTVALLPAVALTSPATTVTLTRAVPASVLPPACAGTCTWTVSNGLPAGMQLTPATGAVTGTPTTATTGLTSQLTATDANRRTTSYSVTWIVR